MPAEKNTSTETSPTTQLPAPLSRRLLAMLYDCFLLMAILLCAAAVYTIIVVSITGDFSEHANVNTNDTLHELKPTALGWPIFPLMASVYLGFFIYFWHQTGQTLGMLVWKIQLLSTDGKPASIKQCISRLAAATLSIALLGGGYIALLFGDKNRTWHDRLSNTKVIRKY